MTITEDIEPQTCTAYIQVTSPSTEKVEKTFEIITNPSFSFDITLNKKIFVQNEDIIIDYTSEVLSPEITASLTKPDNSKSQLTLPATITASQIGTYEIEVTASKTRYKTMILKEQFGVIKEQVDITSVSVCNVDGNCAGEENWQNCPQDCARPDAEKDFGYGWIFIGGLILIVILVVVYLVYKKRQESFG